ncbi:hypothetical protein BK640_03835 [Pseudomonas protegens]|nr:hypothetical protein BK639_29325 [Pseudomonas protegens]ROL98041.1 hypothetical protein BK641_27990 [Pseudomonas protegens]ROM07829.1 hypothetical protein BK642_14890 [Pseudomonas protegens]ROM11972.1 hypothetical protein BK640_03835 [Pseudomonas protegens]
MPARDLAMRRSDQPRIENALGLPSQAYNFHTNQIGTPQEMTDVGGLEVSRVLQSMRRTLSQNRMEQNLCFQGGSRLGKRTELQNLQ